MTRGRCWQTVLVAAGIFALMYALNHLMPLHRDDYDYSMIWQTGRHIASLSDVMESLQRHYLLHGGRMAVFFFLDVFLLLGKGIFDRCQRLDVPCVHRIADNPCAARWTLLAGAGHFCCHGDSCLALVPAFWRGGCLEMRRCRLLVDGGDRRPLFRAVQSSLQNDY